MTTERFKLFHPGSSSFSVEPALIVRDTDAFRDAVIHHAAKCRWVTVHKRATNEVLNAASQLPATYRDRLRYFTMLHEPTTEVLAAATGLFGHVTFSQHTLPPVEVLSIAASVDASHRIVGGIVSLQSGTFTAMRGDFTNVTVPLSIFHLTGAGLSPVFTDLKLIDGGRAVRFGRYESSADAILYEGDPAYRRELNKKRHANERSFGACLRRLRIQRRLPRTAFAPVSAKTIARLERGEIGKPRGATMQVIANTLQVAAAEIETF